MRQINLAEAAAVSGASNCNDYNLWQNVHNQAIKDGVIFSLITTPILGSIAWGWTANPLTTLWVGAMVAPYAAIYGYFNSST